MATDPAHIINHNLYYTSAEELLQKVQQATGLPILFTEYDWQTQTNTEVPKDFDGWLLHLYKGQTVQDVLDNGDLLDFVRYPYTDEYFYINPYVMEYTKEEMYMGRWSAVKWMADEIREKGLPEAHQYESSDIAFVWKGRKHLFEYTKTFGTKHMLTFASDAHGDWLDRFADDKWSFEQFAEWGKRELIFVNFQDLNKFVFPNEKTGLL